MSRPFGVALLIAGYDEDGPSLYHAEPSGTFYRYDAKAIGSGSEGAQAELQNEYHKVGSLNSAPDLVWLRYLVYKLNCLHLSIVSHDCGRRNARSEDLEASNGGKARCQECAASERH